MKNNRNVLKYSKNELIQAVTDTSSVNVSVVKIVMKALEDVVIETLKSTNFDKDVSIKIFDGFYVDSTYIPAKKKKNNLTGKFIDVPSKIKIKTKITRGYTEKINQ